MKAEVILLTVAAFGCAIGWFALAALEEEEEEERARRAVSPLYEVAGFAGLDDVRRWVGVSAPPSCRSYAAAWGAIGFYARWSSPGGFHPHRRRPRPSPPTLQTPWSSGRRACGACGGAQTADAAPLALATRLCRGTHRSVEGLRMRPLVVAQGYLPEGMQLRRQGRRHPQQRARRRQLQLQVLRAGQASGGPRVAESGRLWERSSSTVGARSSECSAPSSCRSSLAWSRCGATGPPRCDSRWTPGGSRSMLVCIAKKRVVLPRLREVTTA